MLGRIFRVFQRYVDANLRISRRVPDLGPRAAARRVQVTRYDFRGNRLRLEGRIDAREVILRLGGVAQRCALEPDPSGPAKFAFDVPFWRGKVELVIPDTDADGQGEESWVLPPIGRARLAWGQLRLAPVFLWRIARHARDIWRWRHHDDSAAGIRVKSALGLVGQSRGATLPPDLLRGSSPTEPSTFPGIVIVVPVFNARALLREALARAVQHTDLDWHLIVIEDRSTDPEMRPFLRDWCDGRANVTLLENDTNLGFVASVNRGFEVARRRFSERPVVLLNSDALVPAGWASRLVAPLSDPQIASVTPMSNDAQILSVPKAGARSDLPPGAVDQIDAVAARMNPVQACADLPTGIGFCMALAPRFLAKLPQFDPAFGRGYGEETDWCQKVRRLGGRHIGIGSLFVEHRGSASFGAAARRKLLDRNQAKVERRYPNYPRAVDCFLASDPLAAPRFALALARASALQTEPIKIWLGHSLGGGAEMWLRKEIASELRAGRRGVVLRVGGSVRWSIELHDPLGLSTIETMDRVVILSLLQLLPDRHVIYSCGVGHPDPLEIPALLTELSATQQLDILFHDYLPLSEAYTLLRAPNSLREIPEYIGPRAKSRKQPQRSSTDDLSDWESAWGAALTSATRLQVFSRSSAEIVASAHPDVAQKLDCKPHDVARPAIFIRPPPRPQAGARAAGSVLGVLGHIGVHKGAAVVEALGETFAADGRARLVLLGSLDPRFHLGTPNHVHGPFEPPDLQMLIARYGIDRWLIPSLWPETFSFTTHEALTTGLPVYCFDLGAQAEAVRAAGAKGGVLPVPRWPSDIDLDRLFGPPATQRWVA
ncbi:GT2 family glycosyltransferase [Thioclava sp. ES.031]|uniref:glycosyltransferase n=1 Tax=Thioclava sp. ES.031 TaxID=1798203 RepID=UPI000C00288B|nr:glycosyltransferase [Thioclava sp. ES.031]PFG64889.1 GT2 family glycosyltransferase [Thioclava sp. ES.031]